MTGALLFLFLAQDPRIAELIRQIAASGQVAEIATPVVDRLAPTTQIPPGTPPLLSFRAFEGKLRHRFGDLDLVLDDAGH
jgi:hypothetical protein